MSAESQTSSVSGTLCRPSHRRHHLSAARCVGRVTDDVICQRHAVSAESQTTSSVMSAESQTTSSVSDTLCRPSHRQRHLSVTRCVGRVTDDIICQWHAVSAESQTTSSVMSAESQTTSSVMSAEPQTTSSVSGTLCRPSHRRHHPSCWPNHRRRPLSVARCVIDNTSVCVTCLRSHRWTFITVICRHLTRYNIILRQQ